MNVRIAPSILSADFGRLAEAVALAERAGADLIHIDIMDGHFVPNLTIGPPVVAAIRKATRLPIDVHLMVEDPRSFVPRFHDAGADWISLHAEATAHLHKDVSLIRGLGRKAGVALNPGTPAHVLDEILGELDYVLVMSVNPGWGGQSFIPSCLDKIRRLRGRIRAANLAVPIEVDGGLTLENVGQVIEAGMEIVVAGSVIFEAPDPTGAIRELKRIAARHNG